MTIRTLTAEQYEQLTLILDYIYEHEHASYEETLEDGLQYAEHHIYAIATALGQSL